jgi:hypothetical protein
LSAIIEVHERRQVAAEFHGHLAALITGKHHDGVDHAPQRFRSASAAPLAVDGLSIGKRPVSRV